MPVKSPPESTETASRKKPGRVAGNDLDPVVQSSLDRDRAWFGSQINYLALRYNSPSYEWVEQRFGLLRPELVILYYLGLHDGLLARDISRSSGHPENTLSRAVQKLCNGDYIARRADPSDRRNRVLYLRPRGRQVFEEAQPMFFDRHETILATLSGRERETLKRLLSKIILDAPNWPTEVADGVQA